MVEFRREIIHGKSTTFYVFPPSPVEAAHKVSIFTRSRISKHMSRISLLQLVGWWVHGWMRSYEFLWNLSDFRDLTGDITNSQWLVVPWFFLLRFPFSVIKASLFADARKSSSTPRLNRFRWNPEHDQPLSIFSFQGWGQHFNKMSGENSLVLEAIDRKLHRLLMVSRVLIAISMK